MISTMTCEETELGKLIMKRSVLLYSFALCERKANGAAPAPSFLAWGNLQQCKVLQGTNTRSSTVNNNEA